VKPTETLARERTPEGDELVLSRRDGTYSLSIGGQELMTSRVHGSEEALARLACAAVAEKKTPRVLVGGLGFGYTLRAALDHLPRGAAVVVCEVFASLLGWNRSLLADLAGRPLEDRRVTAVQADVQTLLDRHDSRERFDAILLDVDNGPQAFTLRSNDSLYTPEGLGRLSRSLTAGGVLAVWSSSPSPEFQRRLRKASFEAKAESVPTRRGGKRRDTIFLGKRPR
jgi:spermidine synthase